MSSNQWLLEEDASKRLGVSSRTLQHWREVGYLKPGTHWRSAHKSHAMPWKPEVIYHLRWCREEIDYWLSKDAPVNKIAA